MPQILGKNLAFYSSQNFTAAVNGAYAIRTTESNGVTMTLPSNPGTGAVVTAHYTYGTGTFNINGGGANIYTEGNPYGGNSSNVANVSFDGDIWRGFTFVCVFDGSNWTIGLGLAQPQGVKFRDYIQLLDAEIYSDAATNDNGVSTKPFYFRTLNGNTIGEFYGTRIGYNAGQVEGAMTYRLAVGGWGYQNALQFQTASPPRAYFYGEVSANSVTNRSDARLKDSETEVDPAWMDVLLNLPVRAYHMGDPDLTPSEDAPEGRKNIARRQHIGFYAQELLAMAPQAQAEAAAFENQDGILEYDLGTMLALAIRTIQRLHQRIAALEAKT